MSREDLLADADLFAVECGLPEMKDLIRKGALVAQNPHHFENIPELTDAERDAMRNELTHRWRHPKILYFTIILNSIAAAIQGWDQTGSNGANLSFPQAFGIDFTVPGPCQATGSCSSNSWIVGFVNSCPYLAICFL